MQCPPTRPGPERQEVPLGAGRLEHLDRVDADLVEDQRELVHQRDVEVALRVLDDLGGLGDLDAARPVHAGGDDAAVERGDALERLRRVARDDLRDPRQRVLAVARVDALGRIADEEIALPLACPSAARAPERRSPRSRRDRRSTRTRRSRRASGCGRPTRSRRAADRSPAGARRRPASARRRR